MVSSARHERYPHCLRPSEHDGRPGTLGQRIREGRLRARLSPLRNTAGKTKNSLLILWICKLNLPLWVMIDAVVMFVRLFLPLRNSCKCTFRVHYLPVRLYTAPETCRLVQILLPDSILCAFNDLLGKNPAPRQHFTSFLLLTRLAF